MYLSDEDLRVLLPSLGFAAEPGFEPFDPTGQVQPSSIDLRLGSTFWEPMKRLPLDLRRSHLLEVEPRRYYRRRQLKLGHSIPLRPGQLLLGRTLERFSIPNGYAGELTGRSSFARLGLMVNATGGFINPGWRGHMPLQLVNFGPNTVKLVAGLPICQLRVVKLTSPSLRVYGDVALQSKYLDDDGGPSYWWRDKRVTELQKVLGRIQVEQNIQEEIFALVGQQEPEVIERLERMLDRVHASVLQNADTVLEEFAKREDRRRTRRRMGINIARALFTVPFATALWTLTWYLSARPFSGWHYGAWAVAASALIASLYGSKVEVGDHLGSAELRRLRIGQQAPS